MNFLFGAAICGFTLYSVKGAYTKGIASPDLQHLPWALRRHDEIDTLNRKRYPVIIAHENEIPHRPLRPIFRLWQRKGAAGRPPARRDIQLTDLRSAAAHALFCEIDRPYRGTSSIRFVNTGTTVVEAIGADITGLSVSDVVKLLGSTPEFEFCFGEYGRCAEEGVCSYNEGFFPEQGRDWLRYRRLIMPLGDGERPTGIFVMCDFENEAVRLKVPRALAIGEERVHAP